MITFFGALALLFEQLEAFSDQLSMSINNNYAQLTQSERGVVLIVLVSLILLILYFFEILLRLNFIRGTRKLKNVRREYQITLNRAEGKRCNFIWDILLYQKVVILDDPLMQKEDEKQGLVVA